MPDRTRINTIASMIALINAAACRSDDAELQEWGWRLREAIEDFRRGNTGAFWELAIGNVARWAS